MDWIKVLLIKILLTVPALFIGIINLVLFVCKGVVAMFMPLLHLWTEYSNVDVPVKKTVDIQEEV
jgi:hypothetical protein